MTRIDRSTDANGEARNFDPYQRGRRFEYKTQNYLRKEGWYVIRQSRSKFPDLIAFRDGTILLVECKVHGYIGPAERRKIRKLASRQLGGKPILASKREGDIMLQLLSSRSGKYDKPFDISSRFHGNSRRIGHMLSKLSVDQKQNHTAKPHADNLVKPSDIGSSDVESQGGTV
jgi:Holliday junction resolvase